MQRESHLTGPCQKGLPLQGGGPYEARHRTHTLHCSTPRDCRRSTVRMGRPRASTSAVLRRAGVPVGRPAASMPPRECRARKAALGRSRRKAAAAAGSGVVGLVTGAGIKAVAEGGAMKEGRGWVVGRGARALLLLVEA